MVCNQAAMLHESVLEWTSNSLGLPARMTPVPLVVFLTIWKKQAYYLQVLTEAEP